MSFAEAIQFVINEAIRFVSPEAVAVEWVLVIWGALLVAAMPLPGAKPLRDWFVRLANHRRISILLCGSLPVIFRLALLPWIPIPDPSIHDEFSHLLLADTLAHGRLANPVHPMWRHFETIHVIQQPTYSSMYPPAQDSFLALGEVLFHQPWAGVVISVAVMCAAICWMMQGWLPPAWALYGTLLVILKIGVQGFWMNSYIGGSVPAIAGALLVGSLPRLKAKERNVWPAALFGLALAFLMNTRPFEGGVLAAAALVYLAPKSLAIAPWWREAKSLVPAALVLACGVLFTGYYNWRVTGSPLRVGYQVNRDTYGWPENLAFLPAKQPVIHHKVLQDMYLKEVNHRRIYDKPEKLIDNLVTRLFDNWTFLIGPLLTVPLLLTVQIVRDPGTRPLVCFVALIAGLNLFQMVLYPFHLGPVVPALFAIVTAGSRLIWIQLSRLSLGRGGMFMAVLAGGLVLIGTMKQEARALALPLAYWEIAAEPHREARAAIQDWLARRQGKQLVIVSYQPWHNPDQEWVYNGADIDGSKVVWARSMGPDEDAKLAAYFAGREIWRLDADSGVPRVIPYVAKKS